MTPREILINKQNIHKQIIKDLEKQIEYHKIVINHIEEAIDAIDEAELEEFKKGQV